jgi:hypothetical protein
MMMEAVSTVETLVMTTPRDIPEDSHLHTLRRESPKSLIIGH